MNRPVIPPWCVCPWLNQPCVAAGIGVLLLVVDTLIGFCDPVIVLLLAKLCAWFAIVAGGFCVLAVCEMLLDACGAYLTSTWFC